MSAFSPNASWITTTPGQGPRDLKGPKGPAEPAGTARYADVAPIITSGTVSVSLSSRRGPPREAERVLKLAACSPPGPSLHLAPARDPGAVGHRIVPEQGRRLGPHELADLAEYQADLLFGPLVGPRLDGVPERADVRRPHQPGGQALGREPAHERGLVLLLVHLGTVFVQPEVAGHP